MSNEAVLQLKIDSSEAVKGADQYNQSIEKTGKNTDNAVSSANRFSKALHGVGIALAGAAVAAAAIGIDLGKKFIDAASDFEEVSGKFSVVFKGLETEADSFVKVLTESFGLSNLAAKEALSGFQDFLVPFGMIRSEAANLSNDFVKLSVDLASFNNASNTEVMEAFKSTMAGSGEALRRFGIIATEATLAQEAMTMGLIYHKDAMTPAIRAQALYSLALKASSDALGDFERTSASYANQQKVLLANQENLSVTLGQKILPLATEFITAINTWLKDENNLNLVINGTIEGVRLLANFIGVGVLAVTGLGAAFATLGSVIADLFITPIEDIAKLMDSLGLLPDEVQKQVDSLVSMRDAMEASAEVSREAFTKTQDTIVEVNKAIDDTKESYSESGEAAEKSGEVAVAANENVKESAENVSDVIKDQGKAVEDIAVTWKSTADIIKEAMTSGPVDKLSQSLLEIKKSVIESAGGLKNFAAKIEEIGNQEQKAKVLSDRIAALREELKLLPPTTQEWVDKNKELLTTNVVYEKISDSIKKAKEDLQNLNKTVPSKLFKTLSADIDKMAKSLGGTGKAAEQFNKNFDQLATHQTKAAILKDKIEEIKKSLEGVDKGSKEQIDRTKELDRLTYVYDDIEEKIGDIKDSIENVNNNFLDPKKAKEFEKSFKDIEKSVNDAAGGSKKLDKGLSDAVDAGIKMEMVKDKIKDLGKELETLPKYSDAYIEKQKEIKKQELIYDNIREAADKSAASLKKSGDEADKSSKKALEAMNNQEKAEKRSKTGLGFVEDGEKTHTGYVQMSPHELQQYKQTGILPAKYDIHGTKTTTRQSDNYFEYTDPRSIGYNPAMEGTNIMESIMSSVLSNIQPTTNISPINTTYQPISVSPIDTMYQPVNITNQSMNSAQVSTIGQVTGIGEYANTGYDNPVNITNNFSTALSRNDINTITKQQVDNALRR